MSCSCALVGAATGLADAAPLRTASTPRRTPPARAHRMPFQRTSVDRTCLRRGCARLYDARLVREDDRLHSVAEPELHQHVRDVRLDRRLADEELLRDLGVR